MFPYLHMVVSERYGIALFIFYTHYYARAHAEY